MAQPKWTTPQPDLLYSSKEAHPIRSEHCQSPEHKVFQEQTLLSDHDLLMMTFHLHLKRISKPKHIRLKFDLEKLKDPNVSETFQAMIGGKFAPLTIMDNEDTDLDSMITTFNTAVTETASEVLRKHRQKKKALGHCRNS